MMLLSYTPVRRITDQTAEKESPSGILRQARTHLGEHLHFRRYADAIDIAYQQGRLILHGRLPSFYLKQVLQTTLRELPGVEQIENQVDVVASGGLSSVRNTARRRRP